MFRRQRGVTRGQAYIAALVVAISAFFRAWIEWGVAVAAVVVVAAFMFGVALNESVLWFRRRWR